MNKYWIKIFDKFTFFAVGLIRFTILATTILCAVSCINGIGKPAIEIDKTNSTVSGNVTGNRTPLLKDSDIPVNTAAVEIFNIRITPETEQYLDNLWLETDEQVIPAQVRLNLFRNGIRVGIQGSLTSAALSRLINISDNPESQQYINGIQREISVKDISRELPVSKQFQNLFPDMRIVLKPFDSTIYETSLFESEGGQIWGKTYTNAQGQFALTTKPVEGGKVRFEVIPELEYGLPETKMYSRQGIMFTETGKPRKVYESLKVSVDLLPGNWLILGPTSSDCRGTGKCFFVRGEEQIEQRIIAIRLINLKRPIIENSLSNKSIVPNNPNYPLPERK
ncbi:MAG: hypothetical protein LBB88_07935 [Planctomycetaceae bacterium]|nr:hypothetical protein [Planctomycetaceae bacterium]